MPALDLLPLDSERWSELDHAYGDASDVPAWLEALANGDEQVEWELEGGEFEVWHVLWSSLCHQGTVYTASYAAVPHLVAIALERPLPERQPFWQIVGAIACSGDAAPIPADLEAAYRAAVAAARDAAPSSLTDGLDETRAAWLLAAIAELRGEPVIERAIEGIVDGEVPLTCPACEALVVIALDVQPFRAVVNEAAQSTVVTLGPPRPALASLVELAQGAAQPALAIQVAALECAVTCPACAVTSPLLG